MLDIEADDLARSEYTGLPGCVPSPRAWASGDDGPDPPSGTDGLHLPCGLVRLPCRDVVNHRTTGATPVRIDPPPAVRMNAVIRA